MILILLVFLSCCGERGTQVVLTGGSRPTFSLRGSGKLDLMYVEEADAVEQPNPAPDPLWVIVPEGGWLEGLPVETLGSVTYGLVPKGYRQKTPADGSAPRDLVAGRYYHFYISTINAPHASGYFEINNGKIQPAHIRPYCFHDTGDKKIKAPCDERPQ